MPNPDTIVFLYLQGIHHLYHSVVIAMKLSMIQNDYKILLLSCHKRHTKILKQIQAQHPGNNCTIVTLPAPFRFKYLNVKKKSYPSPTDTMPAAVKYLKNAAAIITSSHNTVEMCKKLKISAPKIIYIDHGVGGREYAWDKKLGFFDLVLTGGKHNQQGYVNAGIISEEKIKIIGYPKFDCLTTDKNLKSQIFTKDLPIVLYAPHWEPKLSSYPAWGRNIVDYFFKSGKYNLIVAPHILLKHWRHRYGYDLNLDEYQSDHIHVDFDSVRSVDTSYLRMADIYLGDVSSMVYEFIGLKTRPAIFLNAHNHNWQGDNNYQFWELGPVIEDLSELDKILNQSQNNELFENIQKERIKRYFDLTNVSSSERGAQAIYKFMR